MSPASQEAQVCGVQQHRPTERSDGAVPPRPRRSPASAMELQQILAHVISRRTDGRIRGLQVQIVGSRAVLRGWAASFHAVQLAFAGLCEAYAELNLDSPEEVELDIDVPGRTALSPPSHVAEHEHETCRRPAMQLAHS